MAVPLHLICGSTGAGKTTYAIRLADQIGAARFSVDEWMTALFWADSPQPLDPAWAIERVRRCVALTSDGTQLAFPVTREMFDFVEAMWEPPSPDELRAHDGTRVP